MIDLGAGDGEVTKKFAHFFQKIYATETSNPMKKLLASKNITVLSLDQWSQEHKYDLISCLNLLDRCDQPERIIDQVKAALKEPHGLLLVALVLPFKPFVEAKNSREPTEKLPIEGELFLDQATSFVSFMKSKGFELKSWSRVPYLCQGDLLQSVYYLDDALFLFSLADNK